VVNRKKGGRWVGVGRNFSKKIGVKGGPKNIDPKKKKNK